MSYLQDALSSKLPNTGTSVFAVMTQLANRYNAINLSQGFPDFAISEELINLVAKHMRNGNNQYAPMPGLLLLRERIAYKTNVLYGAVYNPETEITITAGATQALFTAITALIRESDEVIVFEPAYDSYVPAIKLAGGTPVLVKLKAPNYNINWEEVKKLVNGRTKMIIINSPHNPTGSILSANDLKTLENLTRDTGIIILSDEVYEHLVFDNKAHESVCKYPGLAERSLVTCSFGKTFHATGWKTGYCIGPEYLMKEFRKVHQFVVFCTNTPVQMAIADFLENPSNYTNLNLFFEQKRDFFLDALKASRFEFIPAGGTYFQLLDYSKISDEEEMAFAQRLTREHKIASVPVSPFYSRPVNNNMLRFCFAKSDETLEKAANILCKI
jgi:methionine aminotransferase